MPAAKTTRRAPGRVNIIGEHTDYNDGFVMPTTTALSTIVTATPRSDRIVEVTSAEIGETRRFDLDGIATPDRPEWIDYAKGVAAELEAEGLTLSGADLLVESEIPLGGGLSSSASFELAVAAALLSSSPASVTVVRLAMLCQRAERRYTGVNCGIMDQLAIACCERNKAMLLDCRSLDFRQVAIPDTVRLLVIDSGVRHRLPQSDYNRRAEECTAAVAVLARQNPQLTALRDADLPLLESQKKQLGDVLFRRSRHVVTENQRVLDAFSALECGDIESLGELLGASHASLRDDYEVSCEEVEQLVALADDTAGVLGSRMVGAGFGGCVLSLVEAGEIDKARRHIAEEYENGCGHVPWMHVVKAADPVSLPTTR